MPDENGDLKNSAIKQVALEDLAYLATISALQRNTN
ncbi:MAG: hypothetical protein CM15mP40_09200 [Alphaproteobacteria bacterium]|nr:MAG: hypothetical protein CM15mP40_09200 [Alphaproteobacteria bacterium]